MLLHLPVYCSFPGVGLLKRIFLATSSAQKPDHLIPTTHPLSPCPPPGPTKCRGSFHHAGPRPFAGPPAKKPAAPSTRLPIRPGIHSVFDSPTLELSGGKSGSQKAWSGSRFSSAERFTSKGWWNSWGRTTQSVGSIIPSKRYQKYRKKTTYRLPTRGFDLPLRRGHGLGTHQVDASRKRR